MNEPPSTTDPPPLIVWNIWARAAASAAIVWHLVGVMVEPISTPPRFDGPPSFIGQQLNEFYRPYTTAMYLKHAYKFFAPNPGDSHLVRYDLYFADGTKKLNRNDQIFPDRVNHWPRLLYHRHFMLTEFINDGRPFDFWTTEEIPPLPGAPPPVGSVPPAALGPAPSAPPSSETLPPAGTPPGPPYSMPYARAFASYLARRHDAVRVDLYYRVHRLSSPEQIAAGRKLDEPDTYRDRLLLTYVREGKP